MASTWTIIYRDENDNQRIVSTTSAPIYGASALTFREDEMAMVDIPWGRVLKISKVGAS